MAKIDYEINNKTWRFGNFGCIVEKLLDLPCGVVSCTMLTYLAVDRATGISSNHVLPANTKRKRRFFYLQLLLFWVFCIIIASMSLFSDEFELDKCISDQGLLDSKVLNYMFLISFQLRARRMTSDFLLLVKTGPII